MESFDSILIHRALKQRVDFAIGSSSLYDSFDPREGEELAKQIKSRKTRNPR